jgi:outer membrane lipoprotein-sorting protein
MSDDVTRLIRQIEERARQVSSFIADYNVTYKSGLMPFEVKGTMHFLRPDRSRSDAMVNGKPIISIRNGSTIRRYSPKGNEIWEYDLKELPLSQPLNSGVDDIVNPFYAVDETTLQYERLENIEGLRRHVFLGKMKSVATEGLLDTRKGFNLRYRLKGPEVQLRLYIDAEIGLLLGMVGSEKSGSPSFEKSFKPLEVNGPIDESLFKMEELKSGYRIVKINELLIHAMNPDYADQPPSLN